MAIGLIEEIVETTLEPRLLDDVEVIRGRELGVEPMSAFAATIANRVFYRMVIYCEQAGQGHAVMDTYFRIPLPTDPHRVRKPDCAFVSFDRWPLNRPVPYRGNPLPVVPDVMIEVASPTDSAEDFLAKGYEYLAAGARLVWLIYPRSQVIHAYTAPNAVRVFTANEDLEGGDVLPGFRTSVAALFPPVEGLPDDHI